MLMYLTMFCSYGEALWSTEAETQMVISTLWRVMAAFLRKVQLAQIELQLGFVRAGTDLVSREDLPYWCANSIKARINGKSGLLNRAAEVVSLAKEFLKGEPIATLHELFLEGIETRFYTLAGRNRIDLSGPHRVQWLIF